MIEVTKDLEGKVVKFEGKVVKVRNVFKDSTFTYECFDSDGRCRFKAIDFYPKVEEIITKDIWDISFDLKIAPEDLKMSNLPDGYYKVYEYPCFYYFKVNDNSITALKTANNYYTDIKDLFGINEYADLLKYNLEKCSENEVMWLEACQRSGKNLFHPDFLIGNVFETKGVHHSYIKKVTGISSHGKDLIGPAIEKGRDPCEGFACYEEFYAENSKRITDPEILAKFEEGKQEEKQKTTEVAEKTDFEKLEKGFWKLPSYFPNYDLFFEKVSDSEVIYLVESSIGSDSTQEWNSYNKFEPTNSMASCVKNCQKHNPEPCSEEEIKWLKLCKQNKSAIPKPEYWKGKVFKVKERGIEPYYVRIKNTKNLNIVEVNWRFIDSSSVLESVLFLLNVESMKLITDENIINSLEADIPPNNDTPSTISSIEAATKEELAKTKTELAEIKQKFNELSEQVQFLIDNPATISATPKGFYFTNHRGDVCNSGPWITRIDPVENGFEVVASDFSSQKFQFSPLTPPEPESIMDETEKTTVWANLKRKLLG